MGEESRRNIRLVRGKLNELVKLVSNFAKADSCLKDSEMYLNLQITELTEDFKSIKEANSKILSLHDESNEESKKYLRENVFQAIQEIYFKHSSTLHGLLKIVTKSERHDLTFTEFSSGAFQRINSNSGNTSFVPDFGLSYLNSNVDPFDGSYDQWPDFKDWFLSNVHESQNLNDSAKLKILQSLLKGDALKVIKRSYLNLRSSDYQEIWEKLNKRYNHKRSLVYSYFQILCSQTLIEKETSESLKNLYDQSYDSLLALKKLGLPVDGWDDLVLYLIHSKLPNTTKELWNEKHSDSDELPKLKTFQEFLEKRFRVLESFESAKKPSTSVVSNDKKSNKKVSNTLHTSKKVCKPSNQSQAASPGSSQSYKHTCKVCKEGAHSLRLCQSFLNLKPQEKRDLVKSLGYCFNCLGFSHKITECRSKGRCDQCGQRHHSLLHCGLRSELPLTDSNQQITSDGRIPNSGNTQVEGTSQGNFVNTISRQMPSSLSGNYFSSGNQQIQTNTGRNYFNYGEQQQTLITESMQDCVVFPTALVKVFNTEGHFLVLRALIDACSDCSYITSSAVKRLNLPVSSSTVKTSGLGDVATMESQEASTFKIHSLTNSSFSVEVFAFVIPKICSNRPLQSFKVQTPRLHMKLADPSFHKKAQVDLLLGGSIDSIIRLQGFCKLEHENICFQNTALGWIASGSIRETNCLLSSCQSVVENNKELQTLDQTLRNFWELEEPPVHRSLTEEERRCEELYKETTIRLSSGQYCVSLPFKNKVEGFKDMRKIALSRFWMLEKRLQRNDLMKKQYVECLNEYISLGHMSEVEPSEFIDSYYIPHHCVIKEESSTTKLRVVFDASARDARLQSLNENLLNGPRLQPDLLDLLIQFRWFKIGFTADIAKMYRQVLINPDDRKHQLILWRDDPKSFLKTFCLNTVTFGTVSAPYLAVKTLQRLSEDEKAKFPLGSHCLQNGFYVDDCIYGADNLDEALSIQSEVLEVLRRGGFHLRKWSSNNCKILEAVPESDRESKMLLDFEDYSSVKTLGIQWCPKDDYFSFKTFLSETQTLTKRSVLSDIAKIFDPLGWVSPCIITAKLLIQQLWCQNKGWDDPLSAEHELIWTTLRNGLITLSELSIPRWIHTHKHSLVEIHGFADASPKAYAAAVYVKTISEGKVHVSLLASKTKVAPLKKITLPRLELMAAQLLAKFMYHLKHKLNLNSRFAFWSDSEITLAWIRDKPDKRTVFVANRVSEIQSLSNASDWKYVNTLENPADLGTRGICPEQLKSLSLWWNGPSFLMSTKPEQDFQSIQNVALPEEENVKVRKSSTESILNTFLTVRKRSVTELASNVMQFQLTELNKFSTLSKLIRVIAYCMRFKKSLRTGSKVVSPVEYENAFCVVLKMVQQESYLDEIESLYNEKTVNKQSTLYSLQPFYNEEDGLLRVSSRLENALHLNYDQKFPIILPSQHTISRLIVRHAHLSTLHGTQQETLMLIKQRFHIIKCKSLVRLVINKCIVCFRHRCITQQQQMGSLPQPRVTPNRPFLNCGVDFAGPFDLKKFRGRCNSTQKAYFAIFVCFATKAVHLEVVIDLTTAAFIACYRRFVSRRGLTKNLYSDCGTNFVGAKGRVTRSVADVERKWNEEIASELAEFKTEWHFNPPGAPHFGGLWEAGVKSVKHHLKRVIGSVRLTYDEFETILLQVEAILNSRPLCEAPENADFFVLTPAHFLIHGSLMSVPDDNLETQRISLSERWSVTQKMVQDFWKVWSHDYLNSQMQRKKWKTKKANVKVDDVVIIKEKNLPPNSYLLGRIVKVHPGFDGLIRVVTIKTKSNTIQRPITKICPLPVYEN